MAADARADVVWLLSERSDAMSELEPSVDAPGIQEPRLPRRVSATLASSSLPPKPMPKILFLDGLRGLAAMMVVVNHCGYIKDHNMGAPAVDIFFVLSAFLLTLIFEKKARQLLKQRASQRRWALSLSDYFVRRFLRVYPLFAIVATVLAVLPPEERTRSLKMNHPERYKLLKVLTFHHDSRPHILWSLPVEIGYYFLIPVFVVAELKLGRRWWLLGAPCYAAVFYTGLGLYKYRQLHVNAWPHLPTLLCGSLGAVVFSKLDFVITKHRFVFQNKQIYALRVLELVCLAVLFSCIFNGLFFDWVMANPIKDGEHFISFNITVLLVCEMLQPGPLSSVLEWSLLRYAGKISFSMYLLHIFVVYLPFVVRSSYYNRFFLTWMLVFLASSASFYLIEQPCQKLAARIGKWIKEKDTNTMVAMASMTPATKEGVMAMTEAEMAKAC